jgi:succinoglycan biosynthesis protein ExoM
MLERLLREIGRQETGNSFTFSVSVTDNDANESARPVVTRFAENSSFEIVYTVAPERNIAIARNTAVAAAKGDFLAFIDDDEFPVPTWLLNHIRACEAHQVAGVLGPVKPHFDLTPPKWLVKGGFYLRPGHPTGFLMSWAECRTGNVLLRRAVIDSSEPPFRREFGAGGEDQDFFQRMIEKGHRFIWCDEAVAYETVPPSRWRRSFLIHRALLRGRNTFRHRKNRVRNLMKSAIAVPLYALALPILLIVGHHYFMKYLVKLADHLGRVLTLLRLNPVAERRM